MLSTAQKHRLLIEYGNKRKKKYENFMTTKCGGEDEFRKTQERPLKQTMALDEGYQHLYKRLGDEHENKDV